MTSFGRILNITQINQRIFICKTHSPLTKAKFLLHLSSVSKHKLLIYFFAVVFSFNRIFSVLLDKRMPTLQDSSQYPCLKHACLKGSYFFLPQYRTLWFKTTCLLHPLRKWEILCLCETLKHVTNHGPIILPQFITRRELLYECL